MADVSEIRKLNPKELKQVQAVLTTLHLLGLSEEQIKLIPQILANWPTIVKNMNNMATDVAAIKSATVGEPKKGIGEDAETPDNIKSMIGFGEETERVNYSKFFDGGAR